MRVLLLALSMPDSGPLRAALGAALGATSVDTCQTPEAAMTWLENRPCDLIAVAGHGSGVADAVTRVRRASRVLPVLAVVADVAGADAGAAWLAGADDVITAASLAASQLPEGLEEVRHPERHVLRRLQRVWYAGPADPLRQQLMARVGTRVRDVGLTGEGLAGLTTQDVEETHSAALVVNAASNAAALVLGVRRVKRTYPGLAIAVVADAAHHNAFRRAGADECVVTPADVDHLLAALGRAQAQCRAALDLDVVRSRETRLRALLEHLPEAVVLVSPEHTVLAVNLAALRILGAQDARQVLGASLTPWLDPDDSHAADMVTLVDGVSAGTAREIMMRTRHLAEPRRLLLRAVPFQRESGGPPAALIVLREAPLDPVVEAPPATADGSLDETRRAWDDEKQSLLARIEALTGEIDTLRATADALGVAEAELTSARDALEDLPRLQALAGHLDELGLSPQDLPALVEARERLVHLEQEELPTLRERLEALEAGHAQELESVRTAMADLEAEVLSRDALAGLQAAADRLAALEAEELPGLRAAAAERDLLREETTIALAEARGRILELESRLAEALAAPMADRDADDPRTDESDARLAEAETALAEAHARVRDLEARLADALDAREITDHQAPDAHVPEPGPSLVLADEQHWLLQEVARVGVLRTARDGSVVDADDRAAHLCGFPSGRALRHAGALPAPLLAASGDVADQPARFELCLQATDEGTARWIAGARLAADADSGVMTWLLAEQDGPQADAAREADRRQALSAVLEAATAECRTVVETASTRVTGPRPVDEAGQSDHTVGARALARAQALLAQLSVFGRRRTVQPKAHELKAHLGALEPLLRRLATDDVAWRLEFGEEEAHACVAPADLERCLTALVTSARDALPLGGQITMRLSADQAATEPTGVRRPEVLLAIDVQGYGLADIEVPGAIGDLVAGMGAHVAVERADALGARLILRLPRAFVVRHAA